MLLLLLLLSRRRCCSRYRCYRCTGRRIGHRLLSHCHIVYLRVRLWLLYELLLRKLWLQELLLRSLLLQKLLL